MLLVVGDLDAHLYAVARNLHIIGFKRPQVLPRSDSNPAGDIEQGSVPGTFDVLAIHISKAQDGTIMAAKIFDDMVRAVQIAQ